MAKLAKQSMTVHDKALGIDRRLIEGQPIPPDLVEAYEEAGGTVEDSDPSQPVSLVGGPVVKATEDATIEIDTYGVKSLRKVFAGEVVAPDLVEAYRAHTGQSRSKAEVPDRSVDERADSVRTSPRQRAKS